jgi:hypothetical protein
LHVSISDKAFATKLNGIGYPLCIGASTIGSNYYEEGALNFSKSFVGKLLIISISFLSSTTLVYFDSTTDFTT